MKKQEAAGIVDRLETEYRQSVESLRTALKTFLADGKPPDRAERRGGAYTYPELRLTWPPAAPIRASRARTRASPRPVVMP
jgi:AMP nucleosidase